MEYFSSTLSLSRRVTDPGSLTDAVNSQEGPALLLVYAELRRLAAQSLRRDRAARLAFETTGLLHDAWLRLAGGHWQNRAHFFGSAARAMRQILIDHARARRVRTPRGRLSRITTLIDPAVPADPMDILSLDEALRELERLDSRAAAIVELRYFGGLDMPLIADFTGHSLRTVERDLAFARAWLRDRMSSREPGRDRAI